MGDRAWPSKYPSRDPVVLAAVPTTTTIQKFQPECVRGSSCLGSLTIQPAIGRMISDGIGSRVDSMVIARKTPR